MVEKSLKSYYVKNFVYEVYNNLRLMKMCWCILRIPSLITLTFL